MFSSIPLNLLRFLEYIIYIYLNFRIKSCFYVTLNSINVFQGTGDPNHAKQQEERMQQMEEAKHTILAQALSQDARARRNNIIFKSYKVI